MKGMTIDSVYKNICTRVNEILTKGGVQQSNITCNLLRSDSCHVNATFEYTFQSRKDSQTKAGGEGVKDNHYTFQAYNNVVESFLKEAISQDKCEGFIESVIQNPIEYFCSNGIKSVWSSEWVSYSYSCNYCDGHGKVYCGVCNGTGTEICYGCGGTGARSEVETFYDSNGYKQSRWVNKRCGICGGGGRIVCHSCGGGGILTCQVCSGHGFFTEYTRVHSDAHAYTKYSAKRDGLHCEKIIGMITSSGNRFFTNHFSPQLESHDWRLNGIYTLNFNGLAQVVEVNIGVGNNENHVEAGVNAIPTILYPSVFDSLVLPYVDKYEPSLSINLPFIDKINPFKVCRRSFNYYDLQNIPAFKYAFEAYSSLDDADIKTKMAIISNVVFESLNQYISKGMAGRIGKVVANGMESVAPHTTKFLWIFAYLLIFVLELSFLTYLMSYVNLIYDHDVFWTQKNLPDNMFKFFFILTAVSFPLLMLIYVFVFAFISPVFSKLNLIFTKLRQLRVSKLHRPQVNSRRHLIFIFKEVYYTYLIFFLFVNIYMLIKYSGALGMNGLNIQDFINTDIVLIAKESISDLYNQVRYIGAEVVGLFSSLLNWLPHELTKIWSFIIILMVYFFPTIITVERGLRWGKTLFLNFLLLPWFYLLHKALKS